MEEKKKTMALAVVGLAFTLLVAMVLNRNPWVQIHSDFFARWYATRQLLTSGRNLYSPLNGIEVVHIAQNPVPPIEGSFFYPAHLLIITIPLSLFPYPAAHFVWSLLTQWFLYGGLWVTMRVSGWPRTLNKTTLFILAVVFFLPTLQHTVFGQFNSIGAFCLALSLLALQKNQYVLAGAWAAGLTFKPQTWLFGLVFLAGWALARRERWPFLGGLAASGAGLWLFAELLQPRWIPDFLQAILTYLQIPTYNIRSVADLSGINSLQIAAAAAVVLAIFVILRQGHADFNSPAFWGGLALSLAAGWLVIPVIGMLHTIGLPFMLAGLFPAIEQANERAYRLSLIVFTALYFLGILGFLFGFSAPSYYGLHIFLSEAAYKIAMPIALAMFSLIVLLPRHRKASIVHGQNREYAR